MAVNRLDQSIFLAEALWDKARFSKASINAFTEKAKRIIPGSDWDVHLGLFFKNDPSEDEKSWLIRENIQWITLDEMTDEQTFGEKQLPL